MNQIKIRKIRTAPNKYKIKAKCLIFASLLGLETLFHVDHKRLAMYISIVLTLMIGGSLFFSFWLLFILFIYLIFRLFIFPKEKKKRGPVHKNKYFPVFPNTFNSPFIIAMNLDPVDK